jgi:serine protease Do
MPFNSKHFLSASSAASALKMSFLFALLLLAPPAAAQDDPAQGLANEMRVNGREVAAAFESVVAPSRPSVARLMVDGKQVSLATVVSADGYLLTRDEAVTGSLAVVLADGRAFRAKLVGVDKSEHLALMKIAATDLKPIQWGDSQKLALGAWVATPLPRGDRIRVGVVSAARRKIDRTGGVLGVALVLAKEAGGVVIEQVMPGSGAAIAGVLNGDTVLAVDGKPTPDPNSLRTLVNAHDPGETVKIQVKRGDKTLDFEILLGDRNVTFDPFNKNARMSRNTSKTRSGYGAVIQVDIPLDDKYMCGPLLDLEGKAVGINISRVDRAETYALPADLIVPLIEKLKKPPEAEKRTD